MPGFTFFIGKGGVGKTTVSSAYALHRAARQPRHKVLLLSTDPAHSLADILELTLSDRAKRLSTPGQLWARQLNAATQIKSFLATERQDLLDLLNRGSLFTRDELEPLLDTTLPGMAEVAALLAVHQLLDSAYDEVVVDTAPMGHAIRLFQMPEHFARLLELFDVAAARDVVLAQHFGGRVQREPTLERWSRLVERVQSALSPDSTRLVLVTTPEPFSLKEATRSLAVLARSEPAGRISQVVLNRAVKPQTNCLRCKRRVRQGSAARSFLKKEFKGVEIVTAEDPGGPILGISALRSLGKHIFGGAKLSASVVRTPPKASPLKWKSAAWPRLEKSLTLTVGKGGVGKTTVSAALAVNQRVCSPTERVSICSIDPAPSLDDVFAVPVGDQLHPVGNDPKLRAVEMDATAEFQRWAARMRSRIEASLSGEQQGIHLDLSLERKFLLALIEVVPPGIDEIFAIFNILDLLETRDRVVIDMAPTGHALEVLRTPARLLAWTRVLLKTLAAHRTLPFAQDAAVEVARLSQGAREVAAILKDAARCQVFAITLPEPLPDHETRRLLKLLREVKAPVTALIVNRVLDDIDSRCVRCRRAAAWQAVSIQKLKAQARELTIYKLRECDTPVAGISSLKEFTSEIWQLA